jgi:hypothetical protein
LEKGTAEQVAGLLARDPAAHARLDDPGGVADLLDALQRAGAEGQANFLARRAADASLSDRGHAVARLLDALRRAGAEEQARTVVERLPAEGHFALFRRQTEHPIRYRFGREPDGNPAPSWGWGDLD